MAIGRPSRPRDGWAKLLCPMTPLFLLLAFAGPAWPQKTPGKNALLADKHKAAGIECSRCHKEKPPTPFSPVVCKGCHANIMESETTVDGKPNPHNAHISVFECTSCHHAHKPSQDKCAACHKFGYKTP